MDTELDNIKFIFKKCMLPNCSGLNKEKMNIIITSFSLVGKPTIKKKQLS